MRNAETDRFGSLEALDGLKRGRRAVPFTSSAVPEPPGYQSEPLRPERDGSERGVGGGERN
jgi:hypothetical protein